MRLVLPASTCARIPRFNVRTARHVLREVRDDGVDMRAVRMRSSFWGCGSACDDCHRIGAPPARRCGPVHPRTGSNLHRTHAPSCTRHDRSMTAARPLREPESARTRTAAEAARAIVAARSAGARDAHRRRRPVGFARDLRAAGRRRSGAARVSTRRARAQPARASARASLLVADGAPRERRSAGLRDGSRWRGAAEAPGGAEAATAAAAAAFRAAVRAGARTTPASATSRCGRWGWSACAGSAGTAAWAPSTPPATRAAEPDPGRGGGAASAVRHLNEDHADALLAMATGAGRVHRTPTAGGVPAARTATASTCG